MLGSCGKCKHWGSPEETHEEYRSCRAIVHDEGSFTSGDGKYQDVPTTTEFRATHPAVVVDGSGFFAALRSRADFACILFANPVEQKDD